jgi:hypothetical protein
MTETRFAAWAAFGTKVDLVAPVIGASSAYHW